MVIITLEVYGMYFCSMPYKLTALSATRLAIWPIRNSYSLFTGGKA